METFDVRRAGPHDAATIAGLNRHVHDLHVAAEPGQFHPTDRSEIERFFEGVLSLPDHLVFVATGQEPLGYTWAQDVARRRNAFTNEGRVVYINHLAVVPSARRAGIATALCLAVEDEARSRGVHGVALDHWAFNWDAAAFFERLGFSNFNIRMRKHLDIE